MYNPIQFLPEGYAALLVSIIRGTNPDDSFKVLQGKKPRQWKNPQNKTKNKKYVIPAADIVKSEQ